MKGENDRLILALSALTLVVLGTLCFAIYTEHQARQVPTIIIGSWPITDQEWFDPRWSQRMEAAIPDYWFFGGGRYTTRDLMGRRL